MLPTGKPAVSSDQLLVLRYAGAAMAALAALGARMALDPILGTQAPYLPFIIAIVVASRYGGRGPGLAAAAISSVAVDWFYLQPRNSLAITGPNEAAGLALFFLTGVIISFFVGRLRQSLLSSAREEPAPRQTEEQISLWPGSALAGRSTGRKLKPHYLWLGAAVLLLAIEALLFLGTWIRFAERESLSVRAREALGKIESLLSELKDAETGQRGYLLTGQGSYLAPYNAAVQAIPGQLDDLRKLTLDPGQQARIVSLRPLIAAKLAELKGTIDLRRTGAAAAALQVLSSHRGKQLMDEIRNAIAAMRTAEDSLLEERSQRAAAAARGMGFVMASGAGLLLIVLLAGSREIDRNLTRRQQAQEELRESEERYRTLFNTLIEGFCIIEVIFDAENRPVDYRFLEINEAFEGQTGLKNARGRLMRDLAPEHEAHWFEIYGKVALTGQPASFVNEARALGRWYEVNAYRVGDPESRRVAILFSDISERKRAEEKIRASEEKFARAFATNPAALAITRLEDGYVVDVNDAWQAVMGHRREEAVGTSTLDLHTWLSPEDRARYAVELKEKGSISGQEVTLLRKSGEPFTALLSAVLLTIAGEKVILSAWLDISDRKKADEALERMRSVLAEGQEIAHAGTFEYVVETQTTVWSEEEYRIYGLDPAGPSPAFDVMLAKCFPPDDAALLDRTFRAAMESGSIYELEHRILRPDGSVRWVYDRAHPHFDRNGKLIRYVGATLDVTGRKQVEDSLRQSEEQFRVLTQNLQSGVALVDERGAFSIVNSSFLRMFDIPQDADILNVNSLDWAQWQVFDERGLLLDVDEHPVRKATLARTAVRNQLVAVKSPSSPDLKWLLISAAPILDAQGELHRLICTYYDITERKAAEEALRESEARFRLALKNAPVGRGGTGPRLALHLGVQPAVGEEGGDHRSLQAARP